MRKRREISPALDATVDEYLSMVPPTFRGIISTIRAEKEEGTRPMPSATLIDRSSLLTPAKRAALLDFVASLVDENLAGRSDMCIQFAILAQLALTHLGIPCYVTEGEAVYYSDSDEEVFRWGHAWVRAGKEVIDGNTDSIPENIMVPGDLIVPPYWGPIKGIPRRYLSEERPPKEDPDVLKDWWPDLKAWLDTDFRDIP